METTYFCIFIFLAVIIPFGVVGNILSFVTWSVGKRCRHLPVSCYFKPLAIIDTFILLVPAMVFFLFVSPFRLTSEDKNDVLCKFINFGSTSSFRLSMWITVALSVEKTCRLYMPFKFTNQTSHKRIYVTVAILVLVAFCLNVSYLFDFKLLEKYGIVYCFYPKDSFTGKYQKYLYWFDVLFVYTIPIVLIICNIMIVVKMYKRSNNAVGNPNTERQVRRQTQLKYSTYQVLAVCIIHCLTTIPYGVIMVLYLVDFSFSILTFEFLQVFEGVRYLNNAINIILYCVIGSDFRQDFKELMLHCCSCCCYK